MQAQFNQLREEGFCILPDVLDDPAAIKSLLWEAAEASRVRGVPTRYAELDPNDANVRVFNLIDLHSVFRELIVHPTALQLVAGLIGEHFLVSNFTANIARPGSKSMAVHADQAIVIPEPWLAPWAINIIWCLDDVYEANGATLYLPGSHRIKTLADLPENPREQMVPFEASAGSIIAMDGRMWHTSGENITEDSDRALLFGYYSADFIRPQSNWNALLSEETVANLDEQLFDLLGLGPSANLRQGSVIFNALND